MGRPPKRRGKGGASRGRPPLHQRGEPSPPPDAERCAKNNGKLWRCQERKMPGYSLCEVHYEQVARWAARAKARVQLGRGGTARRGGRGRPPSTVRVAEGSSEVEPPRAKKRGKPKKFPRVVVLEDSDDDVLTESFPLLKDKKLLRKEKAKGEQSLPEEKPVVDRKIEKVYKRKPPNAPNSPLCHQCPKNDEGRVIYCSNCGRKLYCTLYLY